MTNSNNPNSGEIDLRELWEILWRGKLWIAVTTMLFGIAGVLYSLSLPNMYTSEGIYAPTKQQGAANGLISQYGGLAAVAGLNLNGGRNTDVDQAMALIRSWSFLENLVEQNKLASLVLAVKGWDQHSRKIIWNEKIYDPNSGSWRELKDNKSVPSSYDVYRQLSEMVAVSVDSKTGMVSIAVTHYSPEVAAEWVKLLVSAINTHFQVRDISETKDNIAYLEAKIAETGIAGMQSVFYGMIESQLKTLMLAEVSDEYLLKEVVGPKVAEIKSKPRRTIICALFVVLGAGLASFIVLIVGIVKLPNK